MAEAGGAAAQKTLGDLALDDGERCKGKSANEQVAEAQAMAAAWKVGTPLPDALETAYEDAPAAYGFDSIGRWRYQDFPAAIGRHG